MNTGKLELTVKISLKFDFSSSPHCWGFTGSLQLRFAYNKILYSV